MKIKSDVTRVALKIIITCTCVLSSRTASVEQSLRSHGFSNQLSLVTVAQGHVIGELVREAGIFWGIPYSQPPVGKYRWENPRDPIAFDENYWNATYKRPGCIQLCHNPLENFTCPSSTSEDCLFLNIFVPRRLFKTSVLKQRHYTISDRYTRSDEHSLAVMVFLHGGVFTTGAGSAVLHDGRFLAHGGNVVVVTINYRLGPFGFLVQGSGRDGARGNYGIRVQAKALQWVKKNIKHFGGDPNKITLFGQSAGAESIGILTTSHLGSGLFNKAIYESDPLSLPYRNISEAKKFGGKMAQKLNCSMGNMTCLREIDADEIIRTAMKTSKQSIFSSDKLLYAFQPWGPVIDGKVITDHPMEAFKRGEFRRMPVIMGDNLDDSYLFIDRAFHRKISSFLYSIALNFIAGDKADAILKRYPQCPSFTCDNKMTLSKLATDYVFVCPARKVLFSMGPRSWFYIFNSTLPFKGIWKSSFCTTRVCHGAELPYVFDTPLLASFGFNGGQIELSQKMQNYWTNFAKYGNPNGSPLPKVVKNQRKAEYWSRFLNFRSGSYKALDLTANGNFMLTNPHKNICNFWDHLNLYGKI